MDPDPFARLHHKDIAVEAFYLTVNARYFIDLVKPINQVMTQQNPYYPNAHLAKDMFPYESVEAFHQEVTNLYTALCNLKLLSDWQVGEIENEVYQYFYTEQLDEEIRARNYIEDDDCDFTPDTLRDVYPALPEDDREAFLFTLRGVIQSKLTDQNGSLAS